MGVAFSPSGEFFSSVGADEQVHERPETDCKERVSLPGKIQLAISILAIII